ncbi:DUF1800 domain-containing protein [Silvimonas amylolytica]|uniref:DUF1800 domain-containing protein n=1 Tax=Silvimonas amylolytica TaxID=449663 RepID=A0ABQ2PLP1_9NEIS|nr:DUF1800 domain-containing protein [Silvimonas amylolytica]GGP26539.1 hypothetical protein GCM10010971_23580 [Silvimonas amylolytica]
MPLTHPLPSLALALALISGPVLAADAGITLSQPDLDWLQRVTWGVDAATVARFHQLGRNGYLDEQLHPQGDERLPAAVKQQIAVLDITRQTPLNYEAQYRMLNEQQKNAATDDDKQTLQKARNELGNSTLNQAMQRHLLRALYSPDQLQERMTWFWLNHFSVFGGKNNLRTLIPDYEESAIRPHALGHFRDLLTATMESPAMLVYLDNAQNAVGRINENYAREIMELHTMGVGSGYSQQDVQELARILTGLGVNYNADNPRVKPDLMPLLVRDGAFEFNPQRHDFGNKTFLGQNIAGRGFAEINQVAALLASQSATAHFVSRRIATYFMAQTPPESVVDDMARTWQRTDGDIAAVLKTLLTSRNFNASLGQQFKDPMAYTLSALRLAYDGRQITNLRPEINWLYGLGEPLYGRLTPDGYPLTAEAWSSSGQLVKRFEIARAIGSGNAGLFDLQDGTKGSGFPMLTNRLYYQVFDPYVTANTRNALSQANSQQEWNMLLLSSPEFMYD